MNLTVRGLVDYNCVMQVTIDIPDQLAEQVTAQSHELAELLARALRPKSSEMSALRREVFAFLARGPRPSEIVGFRPSEAAAERMRELLQRNKDGDLTPAEQAEMDEIEEVDNMVSLIKAEARKYLRTPS
jgi:hypothetical protein